MNNVKWSLKLQGEYIRLRLLTEGVPTTDTLMTADELEKQVCLALKLCALSRQAKAAGEQNEGH